MPTDIPPATPTFTETPTLTPTPTLSETPTPTSTETATHTPTATPLVIEATAEVTSEAVVEVTAEAVEGAIAPIPPAMALQSQNTLTAATIAELITAITTANQKTGGICTYSLTTITLTATNYVVTTPAETNNAFPTITCAVVINGAPSTIERDTTAGKFRLFNVSSITGNLTINNLTLRNGDVQGNGGAISTSIGGLTVNNSVITNNNANAGQIGQAFGGGIYVYRGQLTVVNSTISTNQVYDTNPNQNFRDGYGGGIGVIDTSVSIQGSVILGNIAEGQGGGINFAGSVDISEIPITFTMTGSVVANNQAYQGGGYYSLGNNIQQAQISYSSFTGNSETSPSTSRRANAIYAGKLVLADSCIVGNGTDALRDDVIGAGSAIISAPNNWWGHASGPSGTGFSGTGERVANVSIVDPATGQPSFKTSQPADCTQPPVVCTPPSGAQGASILSDPNAPLCTPADYGVYTLYESGASTNVDSALLAALGLVDSALNPYVSIQFTNAPGQPFKRVFLSDPNYVIAVVFRDRSAEQVETPQGQVVVDNNTICTVVTYPPNAGMIPQNGNDLPAAVNDLLTTSVYAQTGHQAVVDCGFEFPGNSNIPNINAFVHTLGQIFIDRTGGTGSEPNTFYQLFRTTTVAVQLVSPLQDGNRRIVMGARNIRICDNNGLPVEITDGAICGLATTGEDWQRGDRGWGSSAPYITDFEKQACIFQQSPIIIYDTAPSSWPTNPNTGLPLHDPVTEIVAAMRDSFLNWVYRQGNAFSGFQNYDWSDQTVCTTDPGLGRLDGDVNQPATLPGTQRYESMNQLMSILSVTYGW